MVVATCTETRRGNVGEFGDHFGAVPKVLPNRNAQEHQQHAVNHVSETAELE